MIVLEMIQEVQKELRLPQSTALTDAHAKLILSFLNKVQRNFMLEAVVWDELKIYNSFNTAADTATYLISIGGGAEIEVIRNLQISTNDPIEKLSDEEFRTHKRLNTTTGQPLKYRIYSRSAGDITVELSPVPDKLYAINYELLKKPVRLTGQNDIPILDADTIVLGAIMLARKEQGDDFQAELMAFQAKLGMQSDTQGESNWQDVEAV